MGYMTIDGLRVEFTDEPNVLAVIRKAGIDLPTLCYHSELSVFGACRLCTVEDDRGKTFASCSEKPKDGMVIHTSTARLIRYRKLLIELILASHDRDCTTCIRNGACALQDIAAKLGINYVRFKNTKPTYPLDLSSPSIVRNPNKCILCGDCVRMCTNVQAVNAIDIAHRGTEATVQPAFNKTLLETDCVNCGQCLQVCPTGALTVHTNREVVARALEDKNTMVIAQIAPAVRVGIGEIFGFEKGTNVLGKLVAVLHRMGFDEVFDTTYGADLTVMEESKEFVERVVNGGKLPLFTSCCPAWVKFLETKYPEFEENLSTCRSPQQMFGAVLRDFYKDPENNNGKKVVIVSIMPCTAKKEEILRPESKTGGVQDVDYVLTSIELASMIKKTGIMFDEIEPEACDIPFGVGSGGGVIFGASGGVTEAVLRVLSEDRSRGTMDAIKNIGVRGEDAFKEFTFEYKGREIRAAVVSGLGEADKLLKRIKSGEAYYDFVEVMACHRGCVCGGGQPLGAGKRRRKARMDGLYATDMTMQIKRSNENPMVYELYKNMLEGREHELLHRNKEK